MSVEEKNLSLNRKKLVFEAKNLISCFNSMLLFIVHEQDIDVYLPTQQHFLSVITLCYGC